MANSKYQLSELCETQSDWLFYFSNNSLLHSDNSVQEEKAAQRMGLKEQAILSFVRVTWVVERAEKVKMLVGSRKGETRPLTEVA